MGHRVDIVSDRAFDSIL